MKNCIKWIDSHRNELCSLSLDLWENPELSEHEQYAVDLLCKTLVEYGFSVEKGIAGLDTAFVASWGKGSPRIGFLAEYDALPGLAQRAVCTADPIEGQESGHGCGHNLLGVGAIAAALALQDTMLQNAISGEIVVYGCPSEEIMVGKIVMAKEGVFDDLDVALTWHPGDKNNASEASYQAMRSIEYSFKGKASHAAMAPEKGLSALDAVELMDVGANYLREHIPQSSQFHYVITHGGDKPNIVPEKASVWYFLRAKSTSDLDDLESRLAQIADGAALMTCTKVVKNIRTGCHETRIVPVLASLLDKTMHDVVGPPNWTEEQKVCAKQMLTELGYPIPKNPLHDSVDRITGKTIDILGSSDISDVSWKIPTGMVFSACYPIGTPNHSWVVTACSGMDIGCEGMIHAAKTLAASGYQLMTSPKLVKEIKQSFAEISD